MRENLAMSITCRLSNWITRTRFDDFPPAVCQKAKKSILDTMGVTIAGTATGIGKAIGDYVESLGGKAQSRVWGTALKTSVPLAALANSTMGHALDFDDNSHSYIGHTSVSVLPAVMAAGERVNASGAEILQAFVIGTEVACKLGATVTPKLYEDGWHSTSVIGAFGAAAGAAKLFGLTETQITHALGIVTAQASGIKGNFGTAVKPYQVGRSGENGVVAALLAQGGMESTEDILEKEFGFYHTFKLGQESGSLIASMGAPYDIDHPGFYLKEFPSCTSTHPALKAVIELIQNHHIDPMAVDRLDCASTQLVVDSLSYTHPRNVDQARFSMQFCLARVLLNGGSLTQADFNPNRLNAPETQIMMGKIKLQLSSELAQKGYAPLDGPEEAIIDLLMKNGQRYHNRAALARWRPNNMPSWKSLAQKFEDCGSPIVSSRQLGLALEQIRDLESASKIRDLTALISTG